MSFGLLALDALADFGWIGMAFPRHPSTGELAAKTESLHRRVYGTPTGLPTLSGDTVIDSTLRGPIHLSDRNRLHEAMATLRADAPPEARARARAEAGAAMRDTINPAHRSVKRALQGVERKITKREARIARMGAAAGKETHELTQLDAMSAVLNKLLIDLKSSKREFAALDRQHAVFTAGDQFRRTALDTGHAFYRYGSRHRVALLGIAGTLTLLAFASDVLRANTRPQQK